MRGTSKRIALLAMVAAAVALAVLPATGLSSEGPQAIPTVTAVNPSSGARGTAGLPVQVFGTNFVKGAKVTFNFGTKGVKVIKKSTVFVNSGEIDVTVNIKARAELGARTVVVTNPDQSHGSLANGFTVTP